jgi:hypothetical protein
MATKSGFSKGWQGFVDHKWSKKSFDASLAFWREKDSLLRLQDDSGAQ